MLINYSKFCRFNQNYLVAFLYDTTVCSMIIYFEVCVNSEIDSKTEEFDDQLKILQNQQKSFGKVLVL